MSELIPKCTLTGHSHNVLGVAWSTDGTILASCSADQTIRTWSKDGSPLFTLTGHSSGIHCVAIFEDMLVSASGEVIERWSMETGKSIGSPFIHKGRSSQPVLSVALAPLWSALVVQQEINFTSKHMDKYQSQIGMLPENCRHWVLNFLGCTLASASGDGTIKVWNIGKF